VSHTIKQILENQDKFKDEIIQWLKSDFQSQKKELKEIKVEKGDPDVASALKSFKRKLKKVKAKDLIESLLFRSGSKKRSKNYYAWWDEANEEVIIYTYGETKANRSLNRPGISR
jgi:ribosomal protein S21